MTEIPEKKLKKLDALFEAFTAVAEGAYVFLCDMEYDYSRWSKSAVEHFNLPGEYMDNAGATWEGRVHPEDRDAYHSSIMAIFEGRDDCHDMQYRALNIDGDYDVCSCRGVVLTDPDSEKQNYFGGVIRNHDIHGNIDTMTGLRNQYGFFEDLEANLKKKIDVNIHLLGIKSFTEINEMYGYTFGNLVLQRFGRELLESVGNHGNVYRMDGSKFAVVSVSRTMEQLADDYNKFKKYLRKGLNVDNTFVILNLNAGAFRVNDYNIDSKTAFACLNFAYSESKLRGQGELIEFENEIMSGDRDKLEKIQEIRKSIVQNFEGFYLLYQPIIDAKNDKMMGVEALIRYNNPRYGLIMPEEFIPIIERDPLFSNLGRWIIETAIKETRPLLEADPSFTIGVNLSYSQLEEPGFVDMIIDILDTTGLPPENLCLEITERCRLLNIVLLRNIIAKLRSKGVRFALDDYGTGYSSIGILKDLDVDVIKVDRSFVIDVEKDERERELVKHFTSIADTFGARTCVEGIETAEMRDIIKEFGVASFQGYFYSKPVTVPEILESGLMK